MIRPDFKKILLDQRGAAVILWCCFFISVPIYIVIARNLLSNLNLGSNRAIAVYGFVLAFLGRFVADQYALSALSLGLLIIEFPSEKSLAVILQSVEQNSLEGG